MSAAYLCKLCKLVATFKYYLIILKKLLKCFLSGMNKARGCLIRK